MVKKGDTLIEVTLAVGIFSMIAIAIASVMSGGTSSAQTALETTLAREEIDTQAEALRFIQSSYIVDKSSINKKYYNLWHAITSRAYTFNAATETSDDILKFAPRTCKELYEPSGLNTVFTQRAFIINTRKLATFTDKTISDVLISADSTNPASSQIFTQATTYPRLIYGNANNQSDLLDAGTNSQLFRAEGIYIIAVKEAKNTNSTSIVTGDTVENKSAFYDFYIRTCWYGSDANIPSTISTVIRLYDPDVIEAGD